MVSNIKVLHLLTSGGIGGIEILCKDIAKYSNCLNRFCFLFGEGTVYTQMKNSGCDVYSLINRRKLSIKKILCLIKIAKSSDIIIVHHDDPYLHLYYLLLMKIYPKKKFVFMVHHCYNPAADNLGYGIVKNSIKFFILCKLFKNSDKIIFVSKAGLDSYQKKFIINKEKTCIVYNGIGPKFLDNCIDKQQIITAPIRLLYIGRLVELKGVNDLLDILPSLLSLYNIQLDIVGDGKCRVEYEQHVEKLGIQKNVFFHGFRTDVASFFKRADIFVYPSKNEIFGISLVEAMAFKCVCVGNNVGGIPEIIKDGINGILNNDNTSKGLYNSIIRAIDIVNNEGARIEMINNARKTAEKFSIVKTVTNLEVLYKKVKGYE